MLGWGLLIPFTHILSAAGSSSPWLVFLDVLHAANNKHSHVLSPCLG